MIPAMTKMYISLVAIFLMFVCNFLIVYSRKLKSSALQFLLRAVSLLLIIAVFIMILLVLFG